MLSQCLKGSIISPEKILGVLLCSGKVHQPLNNWSWPFHATWVLQKLGTLAADVQQAKLPPVRGNYQPAEKQWSCLQPRTGRAHGRACLAIPALLSCQSHCSAGMVTQFMHSWLHHHRMTPMDFSVLRASPVRSKGKSEKFYSSTHTVIDLSVREGAFWGKNSSCFSESCSPKDWCYSWKMNFFPPSLYFLYIVSVGYISVSQMVSIRSVPP